MTEFKTRKALLNKADYVIKSAKYEQNGWHVDLVNKKDGTQMSVDGMKIYNVGNSYGVYGMNAGLYELEDDHGHVTIAAVPDRSTLLFLLG